MKVIVKSALIALSMLMIGSQVPARAAYSSFLDLVNQGQARQSETSRVLSEIRSWKKGAKAPSSDLLVATRNQFYLDPQQPELRAAYQKMLTLKKPVAIQDQELYYYTLLNLEPRNEPYRKELAQILQKKHGAHSPEQIQQAYRQLNDAFNVWDESKYDQALALFRQATLKHSPEFTALYATHLRDRGQVKEAKALLAQFKGERSYLGWIQGLQNDMAAAEKAMAGQPSVMVKVNALLALGRLSEAEKIVEKWQGSAQRSWAEAKLREKQGQYHAAAAHYAQYYKQAWADRLPGLVPVVYKAQLEDINSLDLIALKFRTDPALIRQVNGGWSHQWVETYRMLVIPVPRRRFVWPTEGYVSSHFGYRLHPIRGTWRLHEGIDIETKTGIPARAVANAKVIQSEFDQACGNLVRLQHSEAQLRSVYCHGDKQLVSKGAAVKAGQNVIVTGNTGASASNHLHFGVQVNGIFMDPMDWL